MSFVEINILCPIFFNLDSAVFCISPLERRLYLTCTVYESCLDLAVGDNNSTTTFPHFNLDEKIQEVTPGYGHHSLVPVLYRPQTEHIELEAEARKVIRQLISYHLLLPLLLFCVLHDKPTSSQIRLERFMCVVSLQRCQQSDMFVCENIS